TPWSTFATQLPAGIFAFSSRTETPRYESPRIIFFARYSVSLTRDILFIGHRNPIFLCIKQIFSPREAEFARKRDARCIACAHAGPQFRVGIVFLVCLHRKANKLTHKSLTAKRRICAIHERMPHVFFLLQLLRTLFF